MASWAWESPYREAFGAQAAQLGTAFVPCVESGASPVHKAAILAAMATRLPNEWPAERDTALVEIEKIAWLRLQDTLKQN